MPGLIQQGYTTPAFNIVDLNTAPITGIWVAVRDYSWATFIGLSGDVAAVVTFTFQRATAAAGTNNEDWDVITDYWTKNGADAAAWLTADTWTHVTQAVAATVPTINGSQCLTAVEFDLNDLTTNSSTPGRSFTHINVSPSDPGLACIGAGVWYLSGGRYLKDALSVTLP